MTTPQKDEQPGLQINVTHTQAPVPEWLQAYRTARSISWGIILFAFAVWIGGKVF